MPDGWMVSYDEMMSSFRLAMESEGIPQEKVEVILDTVFDFAVNNLGDN